MKEINAKGVGKRMYNDFVMVGTFSKIPKKNSSHNYGWARTWCENLGIWMDHENEYHEKVALNHSANFGGSLNFFGGFTEELKQSIDNLMQAKEIVSLDIDMPKYGEMLANRKDVVDKEWCARIDEKLSKAPTLVSSDLPFEHLSVGDSHTAAYAPADSSVVKRDGTTLNSQVNGDFEYIRSHIKPHHKSITLSLGNIDVRHHICRLGIDWKPLYDKLFAFGDSLDVDVEYGVPWPVEFEGRKLPKTGWYKDKKLKEARPFWGSREERAACVNEIREYMSSRVNIVECPDDWYSMDPTEYAKQKMESPQSVHLNPMSYRRMNWGIEDATLETFFG